ncbi:hypothetical protein [Streptomyces sp. NPDC054863]
MKTSFKPLILRNTAMVLAAGCAFTILSASTATQDGTSPQSGVSILADGPGDTAGTPGNSASDPTDWNSQG